MAHITIADVTPRIVYVVTSTPTPAFPIPFAFFDLTDIVVYVNGVQATYSATPSGSSQFSVAGTAVDGGYDDGTVTLGAAVTSSTVIVQRAIPYDRASDFPYPSNTLDIQSLNTNLDRLLAQLQQVNLTYKRTLRLADSDATSELILPDPDDRANSYLMFDLDGALMVGTEVTVGNLTVSAFIQTLLDDASASVARNTLGFGNAGIQGSNLASANSITLPSTTEDYFFITGAVTIAALSSRQAGAMVRLRFISTPTLTHSANLILTGSVSRAAIADEVAAFVSEGAGVWREVAPGVTAVVDNSIAGGRLTLSTGVAIMGSTNYTAKTSVFYTPYTGNRVALYDGTNWVLRSFTERTLSLAGLAANTNFDVFLYDSAGTLTLEAVAWTNDTTRATAIVRQDGVYVKSGSPTKRLLGTIRTTGTIGQTEWSPDARPSLLLVSNAQNRVRHTSTVKDTTDSWTYTSATWRAANNSNSNRVSWVQCLDQLNAQARYSGDAKTSTGGLTARVGVGLSSTTTPSGLMGNAGDGGNTGHLFLAGEYSGAQAAGFYFAQALESASGATITFFGDNGSTTLQTGLTFSMEM